jgi:hypothetical protein
MMEERGESIERENDLLYPLAGRAHQKLSA